MSQLPTVLNGFLAICYGVTKHSGNTYYLCRFVMTHLELWLRCQKSFFEACKIKDFWFMKNILLQGCNIKSHSTFLYCATIMLKLCWNILRLLLLQHQCLAVARYLNNHCICTVIGLDVRAPMRKYRKLFLNATPWLLLLFKSGADSMILNNLY